MNEAININVDVIKKYVDSIIINGKDEAIYSTVRIYDDEEERTICSVLEDIYALCNNIKRYAK